ncbi:prolipoprotein diacylglyceryl transferase family protein, partial [Corynebacterium sp.]
VAPVTGTSTGEVLAVVHPTFLYEMVWNVLACLVIVWADRKFKMGGGRVFALYVAAYTLGRFFIELMRVDDATLIFGVRINNITSLVVFFCAVIALWILRSKSRETAAEVRGEREAAEAHSASN